MVRALVLGDDATARYHARQLRPVADVRLVGSEHRAALRRFLLHGAANDVVVPHPLMPHLLRDFVAEVQGADIADPPSGWGLPFETPGPDQSLYLSAAGWRCPATCVEPAHCPVLHAPKDWSLANLIEERAEALGYRPAIFRCLHYANGVAAVQARDIRQAAVPRLAKGRRMLVATSSHCHAAVGAIQRPTN
jgi:hypothetical protein